jgi:hypothetical protein
VGRSFVTVPPELLHVADAIADWLEVHGYKLEIEPSELGYPYRPTLRCVRQGRTMFVEVDSQVRLDRAQEWASFARSQPSDTRVAIIVPSLGADSAAVVEALTKERIGLYTASPDCNEIVAPMDQTVNIGIPSLARQRRPVQRLLGQAYEKIRRGEWQDGFDDVCQAFEQEARKHLIRGINSGRVVITNRHGVALTTAEVKTMPMGALAATYRRIPSPTQVDQTVGATLKRVNYDRITVAHHRTHTRRLARLRRDWMGHMWVLVPAIAMLQR